METCVPEISDDKSSLALGAQSNADWFVAQLKPNSYAKAKLNLEQQGFVTFMPLVERVVSHARTKKRVMRALFPGYIFLTFDRDSTQWRKINNTFGVTSLIMARANTPACVPANLMDALLSGCDESGHILPPETFQVGDLVRVVSGAFQGTLAEVQRASDGERVRLLLDIMGRSVATECSGRELEILSA
jgi:transcriptional antiterminator RfaH